ncbi:putative multiple sugar transport system permease protein [Pseudobutyrivibrio sp. YE44]|uniref:multiple monosaccharide ABC transporter permease n=1 Tax=Pseudobutyrivibrio sp. YE44 TaxID=1520802 RepID=UPI00088EE66A|nr:multiple monosaccharide ABC transporter permease [Pseudobutyrivibrio sp. YE44]SDB22911.1 putative multiple sugar transport system permease protein [Pseudobutyrivibrio sp. YE44]
MVSNNIGNALKKYTMVIALVVIIGIFYVGTGGTILLSQNVNNLLSQNAYVFVLGTGMLLCILTGGNIDLSVGSVIAFIGGIGAVLLSKGLNVWLTVIIMLLCGIAVGAWQAFWVAYINVPPFIVTLAGMYAFRGLANVVLNGYAVSISNTTFLNVFGGGADCYIPDFFHGEDLNITCIVAGVIAVAILVIVSFRNRIAATRKGYAKTGAAPFYAKIAVISLVILFLAYKLAGYKGVPTSLLWIILIVLAYHYVTTKTTIGRYLYAVGGNEKATQLSGINTKKVYFFAYTNMGFLAAFAGILTVARAASAQPTYGQFYEMDAIGACFIGGASAYGGTGSVFGAIIGALLTGVINQGMLIMGVDANYQKVVKGLVLLAAVIFDVMSKREKK